MSGTRSRKTTPVSRLLLRDLAVDLGTKWRELGKSLGLDNQLLNYFDMENLSLIGKGNAMLGGWKTLNGDAATMEVLQEAMKEIDMGRLMEKVAGTLRCFLLTPLCGVGNKFVKRGVGDRLVSFTAARAGVTQTPHCRLRDSGPSEAKETCEIYNKLVSSYCGKFSTFLSFPLSSCNGPASFSFFLCLLAFFK